MNEYKINYFGVISKSMPYADLHITYIVNEM